MASCHPRAPARPRRSAGCGASVGGSDRADYGAHRTGHGGLRIVRVVGGWSFVAGRHLDGTCHLDTRHADSRGRNIRSHGQRMVGRTCLVVRHRECGGVHASVLHEGVVGDWTVVCYLPGSGGGATCIAQHGRAKCVGRNYATGRSIRGGMAGARNIARMEGNYAEVSGRRSNGGAGRGAGSGGDALLDHLFPCIAGPGVPCGAGAGVVAVSSGQ